MKILLKENWKSTTQVLMNNEFWTELWNSVQMRVEWSNDLKSKTTLNMRWYHTISLLDFLSVFSQQLRSRLNVEVSWHIQKMWRTNFLLNAAWTYIVWTVQICRFTIILSIFFQCHLKKNRHTHWTNFKQSEIIFFWCKLASHAFSKWDSLTPY